MLGRWILPLPLLILLSACALERDGLGRTINGPDSSAEEDGGLLQDEGGGPEGSVVDIDSMPPPQDVIVVKDARTDSPYSRDSN